MIKDSRYYYGLGVDCIDKGNFLDAITNLLKSLELDNHFKTYERLYFCYKVIGKKEESKECIQKAFEINDKNDKVAVGYSQLLIDEGEYELATSIINKILKRNPTYGPAKNLLQKLRNTDNN